MACDAVVALGRATVDGNTLFGQNTDRPAGECQTLLRVPGRAFTPGEKVAGLEVPQVRQTFTVLGNQPTGAWGFTHGVNDQHVAIGHVGLVRSKAQMLASALQGTDLVRLALERAHSARQGVDLLGELVSRFGQGSAPGDEPRGSTDNAFLLADGREAFVFEAAGHHWVCQEVREVRSLSNVSTVRQDWDKISPGLASYAIEQGWWPGDGSKLDFAGALGEDPVGSGSALRRWGRATLLLEQQNSAIDSQFVRRLLGDHYDGLHAEVDPLERRHRGPLPLCQHARTPNEPATVASLVVTLHADPTTPVLAWCTLGPPCISVYVPIFLDGELPKAFQGTDEPLGHLWQRVRRHNLRLNDDPHRWAAAREQLAGLQARFDQEAEEFAAEAAAIKQGGDLEELHRQCGLFMQHHLEQLEVLLADGERLPAAAMAAPAPHESDAAWIGF
jgi:secernin